MNYPEQQVALLKTSLTVQITILQVLLEESKMGAEQKSRYLDLVSSVTESLNTINEDISDN